MCLVQCLHAGMISRINYRIEVLSSLVLRVNVPIMELFDIGLVRKNIISKLITVSKVSYCRFEVQTCMGESSNHSCHVTPGASTAT